MALDIGAHLRELISALDAALQPLSSDNSASTESRQRLYAALHDTDVLPDKNLAGLASEALDRLSELRLLLEPAPLLLADHFLGHSSTKCLTTAVELNIPDLLHNPQTLPELAAAAHARPDRLRPILRTLHNNGIFTYDSATDSYSNNHVSTLLRSDHWTQWRNWVDLYGNEFYDMASGLGESTKEGAVRTAAQINYRTDDSMFKYFSDQGWIPKFHRTLSGGAIAQAPGILADYPWEEVSDRTILDIGGGGGGLIALLLRHNPKMKGAILDLEKVVTHAKVNFYSPDGEYVDVGPRVPEENLIAGDFMVEVPPFEVYTMKWCLHDWDDEKASIILKNIRRSIVRGSRSRLVILESVLKDGHMGRMARYGDLNMMLTVGGQERDECNWERLAIGTGWKLQRICHLRRAWPCAIEFVPDWQLAEGHEVESPDFVSRE